MSVASVLTTVIQMPHVLTLLAALSVAVIQGSLEVGLTVLVRFFFSVYYLASQKYLQELNLAVGFQITIAKILRDLNLVVWCGIAIRVY